MSDFAPPNPMPSETVAPYKWMYAASHGNFLAIPILYRIMVANCVFLLVGGLLGTALLVFTHEPNRAPLMAGFIATGLLLSIVVNFVLLKIFFFPLTRLREAMRDIEHGNMALRADISGYDPDVDELAMTFNHMVDRLEELSRSRASQIVRAQEEERKRIARELHDETSQALTSLLLSLAMLEKDEQEPAAQEKIAQVRQIAHQALRAIRNLSIELRPSALDDLGLLPAIHGYVQDYQQRTSIKVELTILGLRGRYSTEVETALYRIVQEALTNVAKHAHATTVTIDLSEQKQNAYIRIHDNGKGFDASRPTHLPSSEGGLGLMGMRERAALLNGTVDIASVIDQGTTITITVPLQRTERIQRGAFTA